MSFSHLELPSPSVYDKGTCSLVTKLCFFVRWTNFDKLLTSACGSQDGIRMGRYGNTNLEGYSYTDL